jgi:hypothetical protein
MPLSAYRTMMLAAANPKRVESVLETRAHLDRIGSYPVPNKLLATAGLSTRLYDRSCRQWWELAFAGQVDEADFSSFTRMEPAELSKLLCGTQSLEQVAKRLLWERFGNMKKDARRRSAARQQTLAFALKRVEPYLLYLRSGGRCAVTRLPIHLGARGGVGATASFDRQGARGYTTDELRVVHSDWNMARGTRTEMAMRDLANAMAEFNAPGRDEILQGLRVLERPTANKPRPRHVLTWPPAVDVAEPAEAAAPGQTLEP